MISQEYRVEKEWNWTKIGLTFFLVMGVLIVGLFVGFTQLIKGEAYQLSLDTLRDNPKVIQSIGKPIRPSLTVTGSLYASSDELPSTILSYTLYGSQGSLDIYVEAHKGMKWKLDTLRIADKHGEKFYLIGSEESQNFI